MLHSQDTFECAVNVHGNKSYEIIKVPGVLNGVLWARWGISDVEI